MSGLTDQRFSILVHNPSLRWCLYSCTLLQRQLWQQASSCCASIELWCFSYSLPVRSVLASVQTSHEAIVTYVNMLPQHLLCQAVQDLHHRACAVLLLQKQDVSITETEQLLEISQGDWVSCVVPELTLREHLERVVTRQGMCFLVTACVAASLGFLLVGTISSNQVVHQFKGAAQSPPCLQGCKLCMCMRSAHFVQPSEVKLRTY